MPRLDHIEVGRALPASTKTKLSLLQWARHRNAACNATCPVKRKVVRTAHEREASRRVDGLVQFDEVGCPGGERSSCDTDCGVPGEQAFVLGVESVRDRAVEQDDHA